MKREKQLYMYALIPDDDLRVKLEEERARFCELYNTKRSLRVPIHITLIPPFEYDGDPTDLVKAMQPVAERHKPFDVILDGYGSFQRNPVFYINVKVTPELKAFQNDLRQQFHKSFPTILLRQFSEFKPHITLGYRDLSRGYLQKALIDYAEMDLAYIWPVTNFLLWKHMDGKWQDSHNLTLYSLI